MNRVNNNLGQGNLNSLTQSNNNSNSQVEQSTQKSVLQKTKIVAMRIGKMALGISVFLFTGSFILIGRAVVKIGCALSKKVREFAKNLFVPPKEISQPSANPINSHKESPKQEPLPIPHIPITNKPLDVPNLHEVVTITDENVQQVPPDGDCLCHAIYANLKHVFMKGGMKNKQIGQFLEENPDPQLAAYKIRKIAADQIANVVENPPIDRELLSPYTFDPSIVPNGDPDILKKCEQFLNYILLITADSIPGHNASREEGALAAKMHLQEIEKELKDLPLSSESAQEKLKEKADCERVLSNYVDFEDEDNLIYNDVAINKYIEISRNKAVFLSGIQVRALSDYFKIPIVVYKPVPEATEGKIIKDSKVMPVLSYELYGNNLTFAPLEVFGEEYYEGEAMTLLFDRFVKLHFEGIALP